MKKERNCECVVCQVEQSLLDSLSTQTARTHFQALARNYPVLNHFDSPVDVIARLHEHEQVETDNHNAWDSILHAIVKSIADRTTEEIGQQLLLVTFTPAIHKTCRDISARFPVLAPEDIAQQASLLFLQSARLPMMLRQNGHLQIALVRNFRKEMLRWAMRETRSVPVVNGFGEGPSEPQSKRTPEPSIVLEKALNRALCDGLLSEADYQLLLKFKWEGFGARELAPKKAGSKTPNAMHHRLKRIVQRLRLLAKGGHLPKARQSVPSQTEKYSSNGAANFSEEMPISNSEKGFSPELSHDVPQVEPEIRLP